MKEQFFIIYGEDDFTRHEKLKEIKRGLGPADALTGNCTEVDGQQLKLADLINACATVPFLGEKRLVVVSGLLRRFAPPKDGATPDGDSRKRQSSEPLDRWQELATLLPQMPPTTVLALLEGALREPNPLFQLLKPLATVLPCHPLKERDAVRAWIRARAEGAGVAIEPEAEALLEQLVGGDLWTLSNELAKLAAFCSGKPVTEDAVRHLVSHCREENVFALADAILEGRAAPAQRSLGRLLLEGASPLAVLAMVTRQLRLTVRAKALGTGLPRAELESRLGVRKWALDKTLRQAAVFSWERLNTVYGKLLETDLGIKTGRCDGDVALVMLVSELRTGQSDKAARFS